MRKTEPESDVGNSTARSTLLAYALPILALGTAARVWELGKRSLWYDELDSVVSAATAPTFRALLDNWGIVQGQAPGYHAFLFLWFRVVPATEVWSRLPHAIVGIATVAYLLFGRKPRLPPPARLYAALFYATGFASLYYAQTCRQYGLLITGILLSLFELLDVDPEVPRPLSSWMRLAGWSLLTCYVHYLGLLVWVAVMITAVARDYGLRAPRWPPVAAIVAFVLLYTPGWLCLYQVRGLHLTEWQDAEAFAMFVPQYLRYVFYDHPSLAIALAAVTFAGPFIWHRSRIAQAWKHWVSTPAFRLLAPVFGMLLIQFTLLNEYAPILHDRYALVFYPPLLLLTALWYDAAFPFRAAGAKAVFWFVLCLGIANYAVYRQSDKQDWRKSAEYVIANARPGDEVYVLGADPGRSARDYLVQRDIDGFFYSRNLSFYQFYFRRLNAPALAGELRHLAMQDSTVVPQLLASPASTIYVLSPHNLKMSEEAIDQLSEGLRVDPLELRSTVVYRLRRKPTERAVIQIPTALAFGFVHTNDLQFRHLPSARLAASR